MGPASQPLRLAVRRTAQGVEGDPDATHVHVRVPAEVQCIEEAVALVSRHCCGGVRAGRHLRFRLQVALSEALANAIICGNRERPGSWVAVDAILRPESVRIRVTDEGTGFDPAGVPEPLRPEDLDRTCGRGLFLIRKLADAVEFNPQGNSICMTLRRP